MQPVQDDVDNDHTTTNAVINSDNGKLIKLILVL